MRKDEFIIMDRDELLKRIQGVVDTINDIAFDLDNAEVMVDYVPDTDLEEWKENVIKSLPDGASLKMREDVEEWLDSIKGIY